MTPEARPPRVLLVAGNWQSEGGDNPGIIDDLALALTSEGTEVFLLVKDVKSHRRLGPMRHNPGYYAEGFSVARGTRKSRLAVWDEYLRSLVRLHRHGLAWAARVQPDLVIYFSPAIPAYGFISRLRKHTAFRSIFVMWDFLPIHHVQIGRLPDNRLTHLLKVLELRAFIDADEVAVMSTANEQFLRQYHPGYHGKTRIIPPWSGTPCVPGGVAHDQRNANFTVVFGGQLAPGRGLDDLLSAARLLDARGTSVRIEIIGDGPDSARLRRKAHELNLSNVVFLGQLGRLEYRARASKAHVGVAITVPTVSAPTFPSKIPEYLGLGLCVVAALEESSDAGELIRSHDAGVSVESGDVSALADALDSLSEEFVAGQLQSRYRSATDLFSSHYSARAAAQNFISSIVRREP